jgi:hypothetical protein
VEIPRRPDAGNLGGKKMEILTPESPRWDKFADALFEATRVPDYADAWLCDGDAGDHVYRYAKAVMASMGNVDIEGSIEFFRNHGGFCDCEILFNVDPH